MTFTIYEAKEVEIPELSYWAKIWDDGTICTVRKIDGKDCHEFSTVTGAGKTSTSAIGGTMSKYVQVEPEVFYTEAARVLATIAAEAGIEYLTIETEGGAYAD
jgi:hypothetical protein